MKAPLLIACVCLFACALLAEGIGPGKDKGPAKERTSSKEKKPITKGSSVHTPTLPPAKTVKLAPHPVAVQQKSNKFRSELKTSSMSWTVDAGQKAALGKLLANEPITDQERQQLSDLLFNAQQAGLSRDDETALSYLLLDDASRSAATTSAPAPSEPVGGPLFVRVHNKTGERLRVWVQVVSPADAKPEKDPSPKTKEPAVKALSYDLAPKKAYDLQQNGENLKASVIRVWAVSPTRNWAAHRDTDLHLTTPANQSKTYVLTFSK
jgi:hypothetical protein